MHRTDEFPFMRGAETKIFVNFETSHNKVHVRKQVRKSDPSFEINQNFFAQTHPKSISPFDTLLKHDDATCRVL